jgi:hypothetical protein
VRKTYIQPRIRGGTDLEDKVPDEIQTKWMENGVYDDAWIQIVTRPEEALREWMYQACPEGGVILINEKGDTPCECNEWISRELMVGPKPRGIIRIHVRGKACEGGLAVPCRIKYSQVSSNPLQPALTICHMYRINCSR